MRDAFRSALIITLFTFGSQLVLFVCQIVSASIFGASTDMDAFLAANTLPQYVITILLGSLGFVFIPVFIDYKTQGNEEKAFGLAMSLFNSSIIILGIVTLAGIIFARPLLQLTAPGLSPSSTDEAVKVAIITWPAILSTGAFSLLSCIYQAEKRFGWQAAVPLLGALVNLILLWLLAPSLGVIGLAIAATGGSLLQVILLFKILTKYGNYKFTLGWNDKGVQNVFRLTLPLVFVAALTKFTPIIDRYLASGLDAGSISHLHYAFKIATAMAALISIGGSTVIFPKMALTVSNKNTDTFRETISMGLRIMWLIVAPVIAIGVSLSLPLITLLFLHGEFKFSDAIIVADLFKIYLFALIGMCLSTITGKGFYALKDTRTLAIFGIIEALAYVSYTIYLAKWFGTTGIALGYMLYFGISLVWQLLILNYKTGNTRGGKIAKSFIITILAAVIGGSLAYFITLYVQGAILKIITGGILGLTGYIVVLILLGSEEIKIILRTSKSLFKNG